MNYLKYIYKLSFFSLILIIWTNGYSQAPSNLSVLEDLLISPVISCLDTVSGPQASIYVKRTSLNELYVWIQDNLRRKLLKTGYNVIDAETERDSPDYTIVLENLAAEIYYRPISRNLLLRETRYERSFNTLLSFYIKNKDESIQHSHSKTIVVKDTLKKDQLADVENELFQFSQGVHIESGWVKKVFEPVVVTTVTIVVVYLFFSLRSG
jgi:hypothetical protein